MNKQLHNFEGMRVTKEDYASSGKTDTEFALYLTTLFSSSYSVAQVRNYRQVLSIPNNVQTPISLKTQLDEASALMHRVMNEAACNLSEDTRLKVATFLSRAK